MRHLHKFAVSKFANSSFLWPNRTGIPEVVLLPYKDNERLKNKKVCKKPFVVYQRIMNITGAVARGVSITFGNICKPVVSHLRNEASYCVSPCLRPSH
jgi:hypothetical protein